MHLILPNLTSFSGDHVLTSLQNPWIKQLRRLQQSAERQTQQRFLCEGTHLLQEAIATRWPIDAILFTQEWSDKNTVLMESFPPKSQQQLISPQILNHLATTEHPDGVIAIAKFREHSPQSEKLTLGLAVEAIQEPGNLGALIRAAVATGADGIWMSPECVDPFHPKVLRASAGQWFRHSTTSIALPPWIEDCRSRSIQVLAAAASGRSYWSFDLTKPTVFLLGNEGAGLSSSIVKLADEVISIPMASGVESLNVGTAGALLLYEAVRQRGQKLNS